jgi:hypothetical protein
VVARVPRVPKAFVFNDYCDTCQFDVECTEDFWSLMEGQHRFGDVPATAEELAVLELQEIGGQVPSSSTLGMAPEAALIASSGGSGTGGTGTGSKAEKEKKQNQSAANTADQNMRSARAGMLPVLTCSSASSSSCCSSNGGGGIGGDIGSIVQLSSGDEVQPSIDLLRAEQLQNNLYINKLTAKVRQALQKEVDKIDPVLAARERALLAKWRPRRDETHTPKHGPGRPRKKQKL